MGDSPRLLVTGFKPFRGESENPSELVLPLLAAEAPDIETLVLPVEYRGAFDRLRPRLGVSDLACDRDPSVMPGVANPPVGAVLMLGQAAMATRLRLERVALNLMDTSVADEAGERWLETPIDESAPLALATRLPLREWWTRLADPEAYEISNSAGAFVCNSTYYLTLRELAERRPCPPCLFVHLPLLPTQKAARRSGAVSMELRRMHELLRPILGLLRDSQPETRRNPLSFA